jgi:hypothetical protein
MTAAVRNRFAGNGGQYLSRVTKEQRGLSNEGVLFAETADALLRIQSSLLPRKVVLRQSVGRLSDYEQNDTDNGACLIETTTTV